MGKTQENLAAAFAGESQARNKYTYFAEIAREEPIKWKCSACGYVHEGTTAEEMPLLSENPGVLRAGLYGFLI